MLKDIIINSMNMQPAGNDGYSIEISGDTIANPGFGAMNSYVNKGHNTTPIDGNYYDYIYITLDQTQPGGTTNPFKMNHELSGHTRGAFLVCESFKKMITYP